jgi:hypothetical protein
MFESRIGAWISLYVWVKKGSMDKSIFCSQGGEHTDLSMLPSLTKKYRLIHAPLLDYKIQTYPCSPPWLQNTDLSMLPFLTQTYRLIHAPILDSKIQTYPCSHPWLKNTDLFMLTFPYKLTSVLAGYTLFFICLLGPLIHICLKISYIFILINNRLIHKYIQDH